MRVKPQRPRSKCTTKRGHRRRDRRRDRQAPCEPRPTVPRSRGTSRYACPQSSSWRFSDGTLQVDASIQLLRTCYAASRNSSMAIRPRPVRVRGLIRLALILSHVGILAREPVCPAMTFDDGHGHAACVCVCPAAGTGRELSRFAEVSSCMVSFQVDRKRRPAGALAVVGAHTQAPTRPCGPPRRALQLAPDLEDDPDRSAAHEEPHQAPARQHRDRRQPKEQHPNRLNVPLQDVTSFLRRQLVERRRTRRRACRAGPASDAAVRRGSAP